jgi:hypothetical protein
MAQSAYSVPQSAGSVSLTVNRQGVASAAISVSYATSDDTAIAGTDYTATSGTLQWAENDSSPKTISVPVSNARPISCGKLFHFKLVDPSASTTIGSPGSAAVTISGTTCPAGESVQLADTAYTVAQSAGSLTIAVNRTGGSSGAVSVAYDTANGTAAAGTDYTASSGTLQWADGDASSKTFSLAISNATPFSSSKTLAIELSNASGANLGSPSSANVTISGDASAPVGSLQLAASSYAVAQSAGSLSVTVNRTGGSSGAIGVAYDTANGTAAAGTDYTASSGTLQWADGDTSSKTFSVAISNAAPYSGSKTFTVALSSPSAGATISSPGSARVTISGDSSPAVGSLSLSASGYAVAQNAGSMTVTVDRTGGSSGAISVAYATANGTAVAGTDYSAAHGTLQWTDGDTASKTFSVPVSNATPFAGSKSFTVALSRPGGGAAVSSPRSAIVSITGDATAAVGSLQLSASSYAVAQSAGSLTVTVHRTGGSSGAVSVAYATANDTAIAGTDYTATSGTLQWADGDAASKPFSVPVSNATTFSGSKTFTATLSGATGGATLSSPRSASVSITGSGGTTLLQQPTVTGIAGNLFVTGATGAGGGDPPNGTFALVSDQTNPLTGSGLFQVNTWDPSAFTGFKVNNPSGSQLAYAATGTSPTTIAQYEGNTVGVYLQAADLPSGTDQMIAAQTFYAGLNLFTSSSVVLGESMMLQVPTSNGATPFISVKHFFSGPGGANFDISVLLFHNGATNARAPNITYDAHTHAYVLEIALGAASSAPYLTSITGAYTGTPYTGFTPLAWSISQPQVVAALQALQAAQPMIFTTTDPTKYLVTNIHVNAEIRGLPNSDTLGWSMKDYVVSLQ